MSHLHDPAVYQRSRETYRRRLDARFWEMTDRSGECWIWTGARRAADKWGGGTYGVIHRFGRQVYAHRRAYELTYGPIPEGFVVMHKCDNPPCIRPEHLTVGTDAENMADAAAKGRIRSGESHAWYRDGKSVERGRADRAKRKAVTR